MPKSLMLLTAATALAAIAVPANAAQYNFTFVTSTPLFGGSVNGSGIFTTSNVATTVGGRTAFAITSITGMVNGSAINAPGGSYGNYFTTGGTFLDGSGIQFFTQAGNDIRFFYQDTVSQYRVNTFSPGSSSYVTVTTSPVAAAVPEPATWAMMIGGFGMIGFAARRRRNMAVSFA